MNHRRVFSALSSFGQSLLDAAQSWFRGRPRLLRQAHAAVFESHADALIVLDDENRVVGFNGAAGRALGQRPSDVAGLPLDKAFPAVAELFSSPESEERRKRFALGEGNARRFFEAKLAFLGRGRGVLGQLVYLRDLTPHLRAETLLSGQTYVLDRIAAGASLTESLHDVLRLVEKHSPSAFGCVMLPDAGGARLRIAAAPSLPESFQKLVDDLPIGPHGSACGAAAFHKERVFSQDLTEEGGQDEQGGRGGRCSDSPILRACWSTPVLASQGGLLATLDLYYLEPPPPGALDSELIEMSARLVQIAVERASGVAGRREVTEAVQQKEWLATIELTSAMGALVAHQVRSPLFAVSACLDLFEARVGSGSRFDLRPLLESLRSGAERLNRLMIDLLEYGRPIGPERVEGLLDDVLREAVERARPLARKTAVTIQTHVASRSIRLSMDVARLVDLFRNLLENALRTPRRAARSGSRSTAWSAPPWRGCGVA